MKQVLSKHINLSNPVYLDYNATTPVDPRVVEKMLPYLLEHFGNPSSAHDYGVQTRKAVQKARQQVANLINCEPEEIVFTGSGTESNNHALRGYAFAHRKDGNHIITTAIEHPAILKVCEYLKNQGFEITVLPVDKYGLVDPKDVENALKLTTILISVMHANNEVGTIQPIKEISEIAHQHQVALHCDAAQSVGKIPVDVQDLGIDLLSIAGHKLYAPKGVGALYIRTGIELEKFMLGGGQENERRAGTENILEIVGLGKAAEIAGESIEREMLHNRKMRDLLWEGIRAEFPDVKLNGHPERCLPNTLNVSFPGLDEFTLLEVFVDIAASAGAACHSDNISISTVLQAMKVPLEYARGTIRFSTGRFTTEQHILDALKKLISTIKM
ncbi:MAG: cysteine desulfurase family protein [Candidatus Cloacimonadales bacterium]|nr:cysteine desulfurase family protein [Candidatus Cloacimonadales bacterium]